MQTLTLTTPDDAHLHLRDGAFLRRTVTDASQRFARAVIMPNLKPPITTVEQALAYRERILAQVPKGHTFQPLMTLYLTDHTTIETIEEAKKSEHIIGCKLYPAGVTTHSDAGVTQLENIYPILEAMEKYDLPLLIHGEVNTHEVDIFEREKVFLDQQLTPILMRFPKLRIVLEHISTKDAVSYVKEAPPNLAATITVHHLLLNRNHLLAGGIHPHYYCLPVVKHRQDQEALLVAATSGHFKFFLGTDSAPHTISTKENACGCAGIYTAHAALELYAEVFEQAGALDKLEAFSSHFAADFYGLARNQSQIHLIKQPQQIAQTLAFGEEQLVPLRAGDIIQWQIQT
jgi:dihydroorotase